MTVFLKTQSLKNTNTNMNTNVHAVTKIINKFDEKLKRQFFNTYQFSDYDINKFIWLLWKGAYPYEYMDDWKKFNETSVPEKEDFYSHLNMEDITSITITMFNAIHYF